MKICFIGLGSIGKRHLKNLIKVAKEFDLNIEIHALRKTEKLLENEIQQMNIYEIFDEQKLDYDYDITFITNPTYLHYDTIKFMENRTKHMFIEKPLFDYKNYDLNQLQLNQDGIYYVAGPLKYSSVIQNLKEIILNVKVYSIRSICSSYLPYWRQGIDYRNIYSAKKSEGGGVALDLIHEWDYITYLFGFPNEYYHISGKYSYLEIDSDDMAIYIGKYRDKLVEIHLDYFGKVPRRQIELITDNGLIIGDFIKNQITFSDRNILDFSMDKEDMYIKEMKSFINKVLNQEKGDSNINRALDLLKIAKGDV